MNNFLSALKVKSAQVKQSIGADALKRPIESAPAGYGIAIDSNFGTPNQTLVNLETGENLKSLSRYELNGF
jgi:hypothetical protein